MTDFEDVPLREIVADPKILPSTLRATCNMNHVASPLPLIVLVCRLGNDSQIAADALREHAAALGSASNYANGKEIQRSHEIVDLIGGLKKWSEEADPSFPVY